MTNTASDSNPQAIIVQVPKESSPPNWIENAGGVQSIVTIVGFVLGAWWALFGYWTKAKAERRAGEALRAKEREQREEQVEQQKQRLRWDQTQMAYKINNEFLNDPEAQEALSLMDADAASHEMVDRSDSSLAVNHVFNIKTGEHVQALRTGVSVTDKKDVFLRDCFDAWFTGWQSSSSTCKMGPFPSRIFHTRRTITCAVSSKTQRSMLHRSLQVDAADEGVPGAVSESGKAGRAGAA